VVVHATDREQAHKVRESLTRSNGDSYLSAG
jgi:hypothetical protein